MELYLDILFKYACVSTHFKQVPFSEILNGCLYQFKTDLELFNQRFVEILKNFSFFTLNAQIVTIETPVASRIWCVSMSFC